jgi:hypothetical protein
MKREMWLGLGLGLLGGIGIGVAINHRSTPPMPRIATPAEEAAMVRQAEDQLRRDMADGSYQRSFLGERGQYR